MGSHIAVRCLRCGHVGSISETDLPDFGFKPDAPIALVSKRLVCGECKSKAVSAWRYDEKAA